MWDPPNDEERLPLFDREAGASAERVAPQVIEPAEQIPFEWDATHNGKRDSLDELIDSLLDYLPPSEVKAAASQPLPASGSVEVNVDDMSSTLGNLSRPNFFGASGGKRSTNSRKKATR